MDARRKALMYYSTSLEHIFNESDAEVEHGGGNAPSRHNWHWREVQNNDTPKSSGYHQHQLSPYGLQYFISYGHHIWQHRFSPHPNFTQSIGDGRLLLPRYLPSIDLNIDPYRPYRRNTYPSLAGSNEYLFSWSERLAEDEEALSSSQSRLGPRTLDGAQVYTVESECSNKKESFDSGFDDNVRPELKREIREDSTENTDNTEKLDSKENTNQIPEDEDGQWLNWIEQQFIKIAGDDGEISLEEFKEALKVKKSFFAERFFALFDSDHSGSIEMNELMDGLRMLTKGTPIQKLKFLFDVYDVDGSGTIDRDELKTVLEACTEESAITISDDDMNDLTDVLFDSADDDKSGAISFDELKQELEKHPGVLENLTISAAQWLKPPQKKKKPGVGRYFTKAYLINNTKKVIAIFLYILINMALAGYAAWSYRNSNGFIIVARMCGINLNLNGTLIMVLMLRKSITYLLMTPLARVLPLEDNILFHKVVGYMIATYSLIHTGAHLGNAVLLDRKRDDLELWEILFTTKAGYGWVWGSAIVTGWALDIVLFIMVVCSMEFVRRGGHFQVFYRSHLLYMVFWVLLIIHGSNFWKWFVVPGIIFIAEKLARSKFIKRAQYGQMFIEHVNLLPSKVTHLEITRPDKFHYKPGDYVFIQIPAIAAHEWHPFTLSSAPEMPDRIWLHVRSAGHWTNKLYQYCEELEPTCEIDFSPDVVNETSNKDKISRQSKSKPCRVKCYIDGPYGTATREIFDTEHAILIGAGIGVTPMAAILQSVMYRYKASKVTCSFCQKEFLHVLPETAMKLKKIDFVWVNRDQKSFEWFLTLLSRLEMDQKELGDYRLLDMHLFITSAQKKTDMKGIGLQMALDLMHKKHNKDVLTGLKTQTQPGRPDWQKLFASIASEKRGKMKVFFCGAPALGKCVQAACESHKIGFSKENF